MIIVDIFLNIAYYAIHIYTICLVIAGVLSFVGANPNNPIVAMLRAMTAPPCRMLSHKFPKLIQSTGNGYIDLSPIVLILICGCLTIVIQRLGFYLGIYL